jgi:hypothetical protein
MHNRIRWQFRYPCNSPRFACYPRRVDYSAVNRRNKLSDAFNRPVGDEVFYVVSVHSAFLQ